MPNLHANIDSEALLKKTRPTIVFISQCLIEDLTNDHESQMLRGVMEAAEGHDIHVVGFTYTTSNDLKKYSTSIEKAFDFIDQLKPDGILYIAWLRAVTGENQKVFNERFKDIPKVTLGGMHEGIPNVYMDGEKYIKELIHHLIEIHHYQRIAFISPIYPDNRITTYEEVMKSFQLYDPLLFVDTYTLDEGDLAKRAEKAVSILLDERKLDIDTIVSLHDQEAVKLVEVLNRRGLRVPEDIAVTSYEDGDATQCTIPALTTIYYPWKELGYYGCEKLIRILQGKPYEISMTVPARVIYRNSCGCISDTQYLAKTGYRYAEGISFYYITEDEKSRMIEILEDGIDIFEINIKALMNAFVEDYKNDTDTSFLTLLEAQLRRMKYPQRYTEIENLISVFRKLLIRYFINEKDDFLWFENIIYHAQVMIKDKALSLLKSEALQHKIENKLLQEISQLLVTTFHQETLLKVLNTYLSRLNIPGCSIALFESPQDTFMQSKCIFNYTDAQREGRLPQEAMNASELIFSYIHQQNQRKFMIARLLHVEDEYLGYVLFDTVPTNINIYYLLSVHISTALKSATILEKLENTNQLLIHKVEELKELNEKLKDIQFKSIHEEKLASIGLLAAGVAHEINNPIGYIGSNIEALDSYIQKIVHVIHAYKNVLQQMEVSALDQERIHQALLAIQETEKKYKLDFILEDIGSLINDSMSGIERVSSIVLSLRNFAREENGRELMPENINTILHEMLLIVKNEAKYILDIEIIEGEVEAVLCNKGEMGQVFLNVLINAIQAIQEQEREQRGKILITTYAEQHYICCDIQDDGCGIDPQNIDKIFDPFFTTKVVGKGTGLGLSISYDIIVKKYGGQLLVKSKKGKGTLFTIKLLKLDVQH